VYHPLPGVSDENDHPTISVVRKLLCSPVALSFRGLVIPQLLAFVDERAVFEGEIILGHLAECAA
jgi:hypothetical protein